MPPDEVDADQPIAAPATNPAEENPDESHLGQG